MFNGPTKWGACTLVAAALFSFPDVADACSWAPASWDLLPLGALSPGIRVEELHIVVRVLIECDFEHDFQEWDNCSEFKG